ncbi:hypothetical protein DFJ73DRAFT_464563 [Zopfochytrium polystomum]|nr:hypothetical protein DFJ73DRAFT_464563 [Zopfochytrium polystomum]
MTTFGANTATSFSSPGLDPELHVKPDLGGIGDSIYTVVSPIKSGTAYGFFGGTSAAAPYLAGSIALLLQQQRSRTFEELQAALVNNATPSPFFNATANPAVQLSTQSHRLCGGPGRGPGECIRRSDRKDEDHSRKATTNQETETVGDAGPDQPATYTVKARSNKTVTVRFTAPKALPGQRFPIFSGYLAVCNNLDATVQHVPYAGVVGKWTDAPVLAKQSTEFSSKIGCYEDEGGVTPVKRYSSSSTGQTRRSIASYRSAQHAAPVWGSRTWVKTPPSFSS